MRKRRLLVAGIAAAALAVGTPVVALAVPTGPRAGADGAPGTNAPIPAPGGGSG
jgi:hypothetical protein